MTPINSTINTDPSVKQAQDVVEANLAKFESALEHLAERVEHTSQRVEHVGELARRSRDELMHLKEKAQDAVEPFLPMIKQGKEFSGRTITQARENPRPFLWAFAGMVGAYLAYRSFQSRQSLSSSNRIAGRNYRGQASTTAARANANY